MSTGASSDYTRRLRPIQRGCAVTENIYQRACSAAPWGRPEKIG